MAGDYLAANPGQQEDAPGKRERNAAAAAWILAWLAGRGIALNLGPVATGIAADSYMVGAASASAAVNGSEDADTGDWRPGDTSAAADVAEALGAGNELGHVMTGSGDGTADGAEDALGDSLAGSLSVILTGYDATESADALGAILEAAVDDGSWAVNPVLAQVTVIDGQAAQAYYLANTSTLMQWVAVADSRTCPACIQNAAAEPRAAGTPWPAGAAFPPQHPGGCRCGLVPADL